MAVPCPPVDDDRTAALADAYSLLSSGTSALLSLERRRCAFHAQPVVLTEGENAVGCFFKGYIPCICTACFTGIYTLNSGRCGTIWV